MDIGDRSAFRKATTEKPFEVYAFEAPIDMMSYYELHKDKLDNCRLVAMNGLNKGVVSRAVVEALSRSPEDIKEVKKVVKLQDWLDKIDQMTTAAGKRYDKLRIILAVDNDEPKFNPETAKIETPGKDFVMGFGIKNIEVIPHLPKCHKGQKKNDWNDELKYQKEKARHQQKEQEQVRSVPKPQIEQPSMLSAVFGI
ncbi:hypothetical protein [uncultured Enterococcus sp.]|uniref:hypothetical protein n=1 Tax=uncultured Enterococcus sp. TaxID=167972 RepID=UPI002AA9549D|nr:hypothetical protein [uncultured Enterococcus sp.]